MLNVEQALKKILEAVNPIQETETYPLANCRGRILAEPVVAAADVPPADVSAMDGYAFHSSDLSQATEQGLPVSQRIPAGTAPTSLQKQSAARIFTGAIVPDGADAVVIQEDCELVGDRIRIRESVSSGDNIRRRAQDTAAGSTLFQAGQKLQPQHMGLLASVGLARLQVLKKLKVAILSSGDELVEPGEQLTPGKIYNSNRYLLHGLLATLDVEVVDMGMVEDSLEATKDALITAAGRADCIISTGGVSVGEEDHLKDAVNAVGEIDFWKLAIKPGKPLAFGKVENKPFFGLPGNPVAVFITFLLVVRPVLLKMQGATEVDKPPTMRYPADFTIEQSGPRQEYLRVRIEDNKVVRYRTQDSSVLTSTCWANALAIVPPRTQIKQGDLLEVLPFSVFNL